MQQMQIYGVSFDMVGKQPIVLLKTVDGNRFLPIWIGHPEAAAILMKLQGASTPRPMTHDLLSDLLEQIEAKCEKVSVTELRDNTFYATITISINGSELEIDSRPSDAIALAVRTQAPIFAAEDVIEESSIEFEHEVEDQEEVVEKFKDFLDEVSPEDFAARRGVAGTALASPRQGCVHDPHACEAGAAGNVENELWRHELPPGPPYPVPDPGDRALDAARWPISRSFAPDTASASRSASRSRPPFVHVSDAGAGEGGLHRAAGRAPPGEGAQVLEPLVGRDSVILLDEGAHMEQRKLMLPAFHGERMERLAGLVDEVDRAPRSTRGRVSRPGAAPAPSGAHPRDHPARRLRPRPGPPPRRAAATTLGAPRLRRQADHPAAAASGLARCAR